MVIRRFESSTICCLNTRKGKKMRKLRSNNRQCNNLYTEKSLLLERKNLSHPLKYKKDSLIINKTTLQSKSTMESSSRKSNELTKISKQRIHTTGKSFRSVKLSKITLETLPQMSSKRAIKRTSRLKTTLHPKAVTVADKIKTRLRSKEQQNVLDKKAHISQTKLLKSQNKRKGSQGQNELHYNTVIDVSKFPQGSPNKTTRSSRYSIRLQSHEFSKNNSENVQLSFSPEFKKQQDILNEKTPCIPKKLWPRSSNKIKRLEKQNEVYHNTVINVSGFINESLNETARSRKSMRSQSQEFLKNKSDNVQLSKLSVSPEFQKQQNILNEKTPCMPKKLRLKSLNKMKELQGQNEVHHKTSINASGFINESPNEIARSSRKSIRSQSQEFLSKKSDNVQLSKLSVSPEFKKRQNILSEKTPSMPKKLKPKSSNKIKELREQNELHKTAVNGSGFINESPKETARSSRRRKSKRLQSQEFLKNKSDNVQLSKRLRNSTIQQKAKQLMTPNRRSNKHSSFAQKNTPAIKKRCVRKSSEKLQKPVRSKSLNFPVDDLAFSPFIKRQTKSDGHKLPCRNTLKRKRFIFETMKKADQEYEDDIYEEKEFTNFINMFPDTSDSELSYSMATPKLGFTLTPLIRCKTPAYKDCFSPTQYALSRKIAEECLYRNKKRKRKSKPEIPEVPEKKKIEFDEILENACKVQKEVEKFALEESDCEDNYFTDDEI